MQQIESEYIKLCKLQIELNSIVEDMNESIKNIKIILQQNKVEVNEIFERIKGKPDWLKMSMILDDKWLSPYKSYDDILREMVATIETIKGEYSLLETLPGNTEVAKRVYRETLNYNAALGALK